MDLGGRRGWGTRWDPVGDSITPFLIHASCNVTLRRQLERGLYETVQLARHAKQHPLLHGQGFPFAKKYFGNWSTATAIGWYDRVASAGRGGTLFRCWAGHWRGTSEISPPLNTYWATDLLHRIFHVPRVSKGFVDRFTEDYEAVLALAKTDPAKSSIDRDTLQCFAIDVYAYDVAAPGLGCSGGEDMMTPTPSTTSTSPAASHTTSAASASIFRACHRHADSAESPTPISETVCPP
ncbi:putative peptidase family-domain-containing protein [Immersiella caudata]|uniref:Peptidase family-domain-containing protein n=1 Tax=Immersiella caudata TaxID=314043 RepID=A0AA40BU01_9PEZI|nr:putative peptidase family-domain-containing protein [Immersiella caudata]